MTQVSSVLERLDGLRPAISAGVLSADLLSLGQQIALLESAGVRLLHVDVMDGCFVPQMTVGPPFVRALRNAPMLKDVHLMIEQPLNKVGDYVAAGADMLTVHAESAPVHIHRALQQIRIAGASGNPPREVLRGIALNPGTPVERIEPLLDEAEMVLILAINPGWGGQKLIPASRSRLFRAKDIIRSSGRSILTCLDGGITRENIAEISGWGADIVVTGSAIFERNAVAENARFMIEALKTGR